MATQLQQLEQELTQHSHRVVVVGGIGVSLATCGRGQACATWVGLLRDGLQCCEDACGTSATTLKSFRDLLDDRSVLPHVLIGVGQFVTDELSRGRIGPFAKWLEDAIGSIRVSDTRTVRALEGLGAKLATTNYDCMIETAAGTGRTPITWLQSSRATLFFREDTHDVLHLHGYYRDPKSVVLGARSYGEICNDEATRDALRWHLRFGTFVFVGCGGTLEDPNFGSLLRWSETALAEDQHSHFLLCPDNEVSTWRERLQRLPIEPVGYGANHGCLAPFLEDMGRRVRERRSPRPLSGLLGSQVDFDSRWAALETSREELGVVEYFRQSRELVAQLWASGGRHRSAMDFSNRMMFRSQALPAAEFVTFSLDAAEWLLDDDLPDLASHHLHELRVRMDLGTLPTAQLTRFRRLQIRCADGLCAYAETLRAIEEALPQADLDERQRLEAERAEIYLLQGDHTQAVQD